MKRPPAMLIVLLGITTVVGIFMGVMSGLTRTELPTNQNQTHTPDTPGEEVDYYMPAASGHFPSRSPLTRTLMSTFVGRGQVAEITSAKFNTSDGLVPSIDIDLFEWEEQGPYATVTDAVATVGPTQAAEMFEDWVESGGVVNPFAITRLVVLEIEDVYKGDSSTEWLVVPLPGGRIASTVTAEVYEEQASIFEMSASEPVIIFSNKLWDWQVDHVDSYPYIERCIELAAFIEAREQEEARCELIGAVYHIDGTSASAAENFGSSYQITAIQTSVAVAVATATLSSTLPYYAAPNYVGGDWPTPTP